MRARRTYVKENVLHPMMQTGAGLFDTCQFDTNGHFEIGDFDTELVVLKKFRGKL